MLPILRCAVCDGLFETLKAWRKHKVEVIKHQDSIKHSLKVSEAFLRQPCSGSSEHSFIDLNRPNYDGRTPVTDKKLYSRGEYGIPILETGEGWMADKPKKKGGAKKR